MSNNSKKILIFVILFGMLFLPAKSQTTKKISLEFAGDEFRLKTSDKGRLSIESSKYSLFYKEDTLSPALPYININVLLAPNQKIDDFTVTCGERKRIGKDVIIYPNEMSQSTDENLLNIRNNIILYSKTNYPETVVEYSGSQIMDGYKFISFNICPFIYNTDTKDLFLLQDLTINANLSLASNETVFSTVRTGNVMADVVKQIIINKDDFANLYSSPIMQIDDYEPEKVEYIIITSENLKQAFEPLAAWKNIKGVKTKIITTHEIELDYHGDNLQQSIKECLEEYYRENGLKYVLLGGDDMVVPVMGCYGRTYGRSAKIDKNIPTDLFYACFDNSFYWDEDGNDIYGETTDNIDMAPEIFVSRSPVRTVADAEAFVIKTLNYEQTPPVDTWKNRILMCGTKLWDYLTDKSPVISDAQFKGNYVYENSIKPYWGGERIRFYDTDTDFESGADYNWNVPNFQAQLASGYAFVDISTHGSVGSLALENGSYKTTNAETLTNSQPTIVVTMACLTNAFDNMDGIDTDPCLSEAFIRNANSNVIAYLGCSRSGWGYYKENIGVSLQYNQKFYTELFSNPTEDKNFARIVSYAKASMLGMCNTYGTERWVQFGLNPIGDPEMPIYTDKPKVIPQPQIMLSGSRDMTIKTGISGCRICISSRTDNGVSYFKVYSNVENAKFTNLPNEDINICITKQGYKPWFAQSSLKYIQNQILTNSNTFNGDYIFIGSDVTGDKEKGRVIIESGNSTIKDFKEVMIKNDFEVKQGAILSVGNSF